MYYYLLVGLLIPSVISEKDKDSAGGAELSSRMNFCEGKCYVGADYD